MVRIGPAQEQKLQTLREAKALYDSKVAELEAELKYRKREYKIPVVEAVEAALNEAVPARQVALKGLGFADVGSLKAFRREALGVVSPPATASTFIPIATPVVPKQPVAIVTPFDGDTVELTDSQGETVTVYGFWGGTKENPTIFIEYETDKHPDFEEIKSVLREAYPNAEWE